ncbi:MAG: HI0074 family nucleotidyltransferase substrate-binding subunit [Elusimicrobia bacterium]|nr:HI0074 family nucleotidyltransferase substrate-binding subunit [Elusimicrobiota bacterium]
MLDKKLIKQIVSKINQKFNPDRIILFGSQTRTDKQKSSDIDLAIKGISAAQAGFIKETLNEEIETLLDFDVLSLDELSDKTLKKRIREKGVIIYKRNANDKLSKPMVVPHCPRGLDLEQICRGYQRLCLHRTANFSKALSRLKEGLLESGYALSLDGALQRFEFTFEMAWKTMKKFLLVEGFDCASPRDCVKKAFQSGYIENERVWLDMIKDRNLSSHIYDEKDAKAVYNRVKQNYDNEFKKLKIFFKEKIKTL